MKEFGYDVNAVGGAAIFEKGSAADNRKGCMPDTDGLIIGVSEWGWLDEENAERICAALKYFSETSTDEIKRLADERFPIAEKS